MSAAVAHEPYDEYVEFCEGIRRLAGIDLLQYKRGQMERRLRTLAERRGFVPLGDYLAVLKRDAAERDQFLGRPIINVTDEGHIITKNPLLAPYVVKITKMWRKLGAWYWLATQNIDDLPKAAEPMLNMIEWWICLSMPPDEVEKIARFRELNPAQKALMLSARKEAGKFTEGVILSKSMEVLFRAVPPSLYLALAQTEPEEKAERYQLMQQYGIGELDAAFKVAEKIASYSLPVVMMVKESVNRAYESTLNEGVLFERRMFHSLFSTEDQKEGMAAFVEKRKPKFKHR